MSEFAPIPLDLQLRRAFLEYEREGKIFDLPRRAFFCGLPGLDLSVRTNGHAAFTPLGPAAGPHTQLLQNIVLSWLGGSRIIELKTVQVLDALKIPRPCIDSETVTYNVEWSQELSLQQSLREYVSAMMFLEILKTSSLLGEDLPRGFYDTVFDMSAGYNLEGIQSAPMRTWFTGMMDASTLVDELRPLLAGRFAAYRDLPFPSRVSDTVTLSTFHGCPPEEIERIVTFFLTEVGLNVCVKMNPTLLGQQQVDHLLHDVLGYRDIDLIPDAFEHDLHLDAALDLIPRLQSVARSCGRRFSLKFSNTLVVRNHRTVFSDERMYLSGPPLHVLTLNLVRAFRERMPSAPPLSFSAGMTANNVASVVAMNFVPVTTCSDLLRPGGYGRLHRYMDNLGAAMRDCSAATIPEFVLRHSGQGRDAIHAVTAAMLADATQLAGPALARETVIPFITDVEAQLMRWFRSPGRPLRSLCREIADEFAHVASRIPHELAAHLRTHVSGLQDALVNSAGELNTPILVTRATAEPRYRWASNRTVPKTIAAELALFDCISCDKCVAGCPNDAMFAYSGEPFAVDYSNYELLPGSEFRAISGGTFCITHSRQFANFADACNDCGNCGVLCPEHGDPNLRKPRFFGSLESFNAHRDTGGFYIAFDAGQKTIHGVIAGHRYRLAIDPAADCARFEDETAEYVLQPSRNALIAWHAFDASGAVPARLDLLPYFQLKFMLDNVSDSRHVHYANVAGLEE